MIDSDFAAERDALIAARRTATAIAHRPAAWIPADLAEAYRLQTEVIGALGSTGAWKVAGLTEPQRRAMGVPAPIAAALPFVLDADGSVAGLRLADFIAPKIECEFAFELGADLPIRSRPYERAEVAGAVAAMRLAIEIVDSRFPAGSGALSEVADGSNNGSFVAGPRVRDWQALDPGTVNIVLTFTDAAGATTPFAQGNGRAILEGDPFAAVVLLANAQPPGAGLRAGQIVTTGSCTGAPFVTRTGTYRAVFDGLGEIAVAIG